MASYTYDAAEPTARDRVRGLAGDTSATDQDRAERVCDEFIDGLLAANGVDELAAAIVCVERRAAAIAGQKSNAEMAPGLETQRRFDRLQALLKDLRKRQAGTAGAPLPSMSMAGLISDPSSTAVEMPRLGALDGPVTVTV